MSNLTLLKSKNTHKLLVLPIKNKKDLALALENVKIRDYEIEIRDKNTNSMVLYLLNLLGVRGSEETHIHHLVCANFINNNLINYTYQEIKLAFEKYVLGEFFDSKGDKVLVTQQLNSVVIGNVMSCYAELKKNELDDYRRKRKEIILKERNNNKELSDKEKKDLIRNGVIECYNYYCEFDEIKIGYAYVYDVLYDLGLLEKDNEKKRDILSIAISRVNIEVKQKKPKSYHELKEIKTLIKKAKENLLVNDYKLKAKEISIEMFFNKIKNSKKQITDYI